MLSSPLSRTPSFTLEATKSIHLQNVQACSNFNNAKGRFLLPTSKTYRLHHVRPHLYQSTNCFMSFLFLSAAHAHHVVTTSKRRILVQLLQTQFFFGVHRTGTQLSSRCRCRSKSSYLCYKMVSLSNLSAVYSFFNICHQNIYQTSSISLVLCYITVVCGISDDNGLIPV